MSEINRGAPRIQEKSWSEIQRNKTFAIAAGIAGMFMQPDLPDEDEKDHRAKIEVIVDETPYNETFDKPEFFEHGRGSLTKEEQPDRIEALPNGEIVFHDAGLTFYKVQRGDTISEIRERLAKYPKYTYLKTQRAKLESFNIPALELKAGMWLPIPMENADRELTDEEFVHYAKLAIKNLVENPGPYQKAVEKILRKISPDEFVASLEAVAKQESGGKPIGQFELHRYEPAYDTFSYSMFHVLMEGAGLKARINLDVTEGQTYHPQNACELLVGFMVEKAKPRHIKPESFFPLDKGDHAEKFAVFYNGSGWKRINPDYTNNLITYYHDSLKQLVHTRPSTQ